MAFTEKDITQIRRHLPKNYRQKIVEKCQENGVYITVRVVSLVLDNQYRNTGIIMAVTQAVSDLVKESKDAEAFIQQKIAEIVK